MRNNSILEKELLDVCLVGDTKEACRILRTGGINPNVRGRCGHTPLMLASIYGHKDIVMLLLKHGADPDMQSDYGYSALLYASENKDIAVVRLLLEHKANPNIINMFNETPLTMSSKTGHATMHKGGEDVVELLRQYGAVRYR